MSDPRIDEHELDRFLNDLVSGETSAAGYRLDAETTDAVRKVRALAFAALPDPAWERIDSTIRTGIAAAAAEAQPMSTHLASTTIFGPADSTVFARNGRSGIPKGRVAERSAPHRGWALAHLATAALILLTLAASLLAIRALPTPDTGIGIPIMAPEGQPLPEILVDTVVSDLPGGQTDVTLAMFEFRGSESTLTLMERAEGPTVVVALTDSLTVTVDGSDHQLQAGDSIIVPGDGFVSNRTPAEARAVVLTLSRYAKIWEIGPELTLKTAFILHTAAIPRGPARVAIERTTLSGGETLPPFTATELEWIGVFDGQPKVTLTGDGPSEWTSGKERLVLPNFATPQLTPGWEVSIRNPGADPVEVYRLIVAPKKIDLSDPTGPTGTG